MQAAIAVLGGALKLRFVSRETFGNIVDLVTVGGDLRHGPAANGPPKPLQRRCPGVAPKAGLNQLKHLEQPNNGDTLDEQRPEQLGPQV